jgi:hypothetical protein
MLMIMAPVAEFERKISPGWRKILRLPALLRRQLCESAAAMYPSEGNAG